MKIEDKVKIHDCYKNLKPSDGSSAILRKGIVSAIQYRIKNKDNDNDLRNDFLNSIDHIFGQHNKCQSYFCNKENTINYLEKIKATDSLFYYNLIQPVRYLARYSHSLMHNVDSNIVESLNDVIAKLIGGKRVNFAMIRSYQGRVSAAATVIKNTKRPLYLLNKAIGVCRHLCQGGPRQY
ncbi:hypothetical protein QTP88_008233 [Uroleucon formosanum]